METTEKPLSGQIVRAGGSAGSNALALRSATLVARGLRDLARESNWLRVQAFRGKASKVAVSSVGTACAISAESRGTSPRVTVYDVHNSYAQMALAVPEETPALAKYLPATFAWSPTGKFLAGTWAAWQPSIHLFDLGDKEFVGSFGKFKQPPSYLAWSANEHFIAAATPGGKLASLRLWVLGEHGESIEDPTAAHAGVPDWLERQTYEAEFGEEGAFGGYGRTTFSPDGKSLASVIEIHGEWADDSILIAEAPSLRKIQSFQAQGHITDLSWTSGGGSLIYCAAGQTYRLDRETLELELLPFTAEMCTAHPRLPLAICFSSWVRESARGQLFAVELTTGRVFDKCGADGVTELRWSEDGIKAYAVAKDGAVYIYEPLAL
jgi:WD40 repeat protein